MPSPVPVFGRRNKPASARAAPPVTPDHAAFFAAVRAELAQDEARPRLVPRSFRAALLAGLVVGCFLASLDIAQARHVDPALAALLHANGLDIGRGALPYVIALSLVGGARTAAAILLLAHRLLALAGQTSHAAYAAGGAVIAGLYALAIAAITHEPPPHGWLIALMAGAATGAFYRLFAGAEIAGAQDPK